MSQMLLAAFALFGFSVVCAMAQEIDMEIPVRPQQDETDLIDDRKPAITPDSQLPFHKTKRMVITWVAPYAVAKSKARLTESFDDVGMKDGLTHLALQFWQPTTDEKICRTRQGDDIGDGTVAELRDWGHANGVRMMLCVYNGGKSWNWPLARAAFAGHPKEFAAALVAEVERLDLDGVDVDLEGNGQLEADREAFVRFVSELSVRLHVRKKHLTVDSFPYIWNAPNQGWWKDLLPLVDGLNSMGYDELGSAEKGWRAYAAQETLCGVNAAKLSIGVPSDANQWRGNKALEHLRWVRDHGKMGVALWDAQLEAPAWRTHDVWATLQQIRGLK